MRRGVPAVGLLFTVAACGSGGGETGSRLRFVDATATSGLDRFVQVNGGPEKRFVIESFGAGVALFDCDLDGDLDAYLANGSSLDGFADGEGPRDALFLNDGAGHFTDGTEAAGLGDRSWTFGVRVADHDGDGDPDVYLTNHGPNVLYENQGDGRFVDVTERAGVGDAAWSTGACFLDFDRDGDLDLYVVNHLDFDREWIEANHPHEIYRGQEVYYGPRGLTAIADRFYENQGDGTYRDATADVGVGTPAYFGFHAIAFDADGDGWTDVYVANDSTPNLLWRNVGGERFEEVAVRSGAALSVEGGPQAGMGVCVGDFDGDLEADLFVTNFSEDYFTLYRGEGAGFFSDATKRAGLYASTMSSLGWACFFGDFDSDGDADLFAANGHVFPQIDGLDASSHYLQRNQLFENLGSGRFRSPAGVGGPGFERPRSGRGAAVGDVDGDGDLDLLVGNLDGPPTLLVNETPDPGRWLRVRLVGAGKNRDAIGARVVATFGDRRVMRLVGAGDGFLSSSEPTLHFGLGAATRVDELVVTWPDGQVERVGGLDAGVLVTVREGEGVVSTADGGG